MPTKKATAQKSSSSSGMGMGDLWKWVYLIGLIVAGLVGAFGSFLGGAQMIVGYLVLLAAILSGIFYLDPEDLLNYGVRVLLFFAVLKGFDAIPAIGTYLSGFLGGVWSFLAPASLTLLVVHFVRKHFAM